MRNRPKNRGVFSFFPGANVLGALLLVGWVAPLPAEGDPETLSPSLPETVAPRRVLPGAFSPLEDSADALMAGLFKLFPSKRSLPEHLRHRPHEDYPMAFRWIPRWLTAFSWGRPSLMVGNQDNAYEGSPKPIGERGSFQISRYPDLPPPLCWLPLYFAFTTHDGLHMRLGARWDDIDAYTQFPSIAWKRVKHKKMQLPPEADVNTGGT